MTFKDLEIVRTALGAVSIRNKIHGEILHNPTGPWLEARGLYVKQTQLGQRLQEKIDTPLYLFDVGLGAGFNALAAIECYLDLKNPRPLRLLSFEIDFTLFDFILENIDAFEESKRFKTQMEIFRKSGHYEQDAFSWAYRGNFLDKKWDAEERAEIIFFDPYSSKVDSEMWTFETFQIVAKALNPEIANCLATYSSSTSVRTAMLLSGLSVGVGEGSSAKKETTFASTQISEVKTPLKERWLQRWERSNEALPRSSINQKFNLETVYTELLNHPQFKGLAKRHDLSSK